MPSRLQRKGFDKERDLVIKLWREGLAAIRGPASGARTKHIVYPDVVAIYRGVVLVLEVKYRAKPETIYIESEKLERLREFARRAGGRILIAVKYAGGEWRFVDPDSCKVTESGRIRVDPEVVEKSPTLRELVNSLKGQKSITEYLEDRGVNTG